MIYLLFSATFIKSIGPWNQGDKNNSWTKETTATSNEASKSFCQLSFDLFFTVGILIDWEMH